MNAPNATDTNGRPGAVTGMESAPTSAATSAKTSQSSHGRSGPRTPEGRAHVALNPISHGIFARTLVLPGAERLEDWEAHVAGVLESLAPVGHVETLLAQRAADAFWRLARLRRYETAMLQRCQEHAEEEFGGYVCEAANIWGGSFYDWHPDKKLDVPSILRGARELLESYTNMAEDSVVQLLRARMALRVLAELENRWEDLAAVPGLRLQETIGPEEQWTGAQFRAAVALVLANVRREPQAVIDAAIAALQDAEHQAPRRLQELRNQRQRLQAVYLLPKSETLLQLTRYEAHLTRQLNHALHELEVLQARRRGERVHLGRISVSGLREEPSAVSEVSEELTRFALQNGS